MKGSTSSPTHATGGAILFSIGPQRHRSQRTVGVIFEGYRLNIYLSTEYHTASTRRIVAMRVALSGAADMHYRYGAQRSGYVDPRRPLPRPPTGRLSFTLPALSEDKNLLFVFLFLLLCSTAIPQRAPQAPSPISSSPPPLWCIPVSRRPRATCESFGWPRRGAIANIYTTSSWGARVLESTDLKPMFWNLFYLEYFRG